MMPLPVAMFFALAATSPSAPLFDPIRLNIGISCRWDRSCIDHQERAMRKGLAYVGKYHPPLWRVQQCNRNAARGTAQVDWVGFDNCIRNAALVYRPPPVPPKPVRKRRPRR